MDHDSKKGSQPLTIFTIGWCRKSAEDFFGTLRAAGVQRVIDVRLSNNSQLAGFTKRGNLEYFLRVLTGIDYAHCVDLAPSRELFEDYQAKRTDWQGYEPRFKSLMAERQPHRQYSRAFFDHGCLLCSEPDPEACHRRLVAEHLARQWGNVRIRHL